MQGPASAGPGRANARPYVLRLGMTYNPRRSSLPTQSDSDERTPVRLLEGSRCDAGAAPATVTGDDSRMVA